MRVAKEVAKEFEPYFDKPIVTQIEAAQEFFRAEEYHQDYIEKTGQPCHGGNPWPEVLK